MPLPIPWQQTANTNPGSNPIKESLFTVYDVWDHFRVRPVDRGRGGRWAASLVQSSLVWSGENPRLGLVPPPPIPAPPRSSPIPRLFSFSQAAGELRWWRRAGQEQAVRAAASREGSVVPTTSMLMVVGQSSSSTNCGQHRPPVAVTMMLSVCVLKNTTTQWRASRPD